MIGELEQDLHDLIRDTPGEQLRQVGMLPQIDAQAILHKLLISAPAVYTNLRPFSVKNHRAEIAFDVIMLARNARGYDAALKGDATTVGLYEMIEQLVNRFDSAPGWSLGQVSRPRDAAFLENGLYAASMTVTRAVALPFEIDLDALDAFILAHHEFDIDTTQTDEPAAVDNVILPQ